VSKKVMQISFYDIEVVNLSVLGKNKRIKTG